MPRPAVAEVYQRTGALVLRRCRFLLGDEAEAEDALQEVFVRLMRYGAFSRAEEVPLAWLYRVAEGCCFDRLRKTKREPVAVTPEVWESLGTPDGVARYEAVEIIWRFFHRLDPKLQQVALLHYLDGLSQEQIAEALGWSRRTVGKKIKQLRQRAERLARRTH